MGTSARFNVCASPPSDPLLAAWNYSGSGAVIADLSGNGHSFVLTGTTGRVGGYTYGGSQPGVQGIRQTAAEIQLGPPIDGMQPNEITVMTWAITGPADPSWFLEYHRDVPDDTGVLGWLFAATLRGRAKDATNTAFETVIPTDSPNWHHHAITHNGATLSVYRDGVLAGAQPMGPIWSADILRILTNAGPGVVLSETRFFNQALSAAEIATWMNVPVT